MEETADQCRHSAVVGTVEGRLPARSHKTRASRPRGAGPSRELRPRSGLKVGLAGGSGSSGREMGADPNGSTVIPIKRTLRVIANPPLLAPAPPMSMKFNYIGIVVVLGVGIWAATRSEEEFKKGSFAGILDGVVVDGEDIDDKDDDFADIIGQPNMRGGGAGEGGPEGGAGAGGEQGEEAAAPPTKR